MRRSLALALVLLVTTIGMAASAPGASAVSFHTPSSPSYLLAPQVEPTKFRFPSTKFGEFFLEPICTESTIEGVAATPTVEQIQLFAQYAHCTTQGLPITVHMNGCSYTVTPAGSAPVFGANLKLTCPPEQKVSFDFGGYCQIFLLPQTAPKSNFELFNEGIHTRLVGAAKELTYTTNPPSELTPCRKAMNNAEVVLNLAVKAYSDMGRSKQITFSVK